MSSLQLSFLRHRLLFHCLVLSFVSFIIDSLPLTRSLCLLSFFLTISGNPIYARRPFLMHYFLFCTSFFSLQTSLARRRDLYVESLNQTQYDAIFFCFILWIDKDLQYWREKKYIDWLISNLWLLGTEISLSQFWAITMSVAGGIKFF